MKQELEQSKISKSNTNLEFFTAFFLKSKRKTKQKSKFVV